MKILITEPTYKHAIALARYLKDYDPSLEIVGASSYQPKFPKLFTKYYDRFVVSRLEEIVKSEEHQLLIPVGNQSVEIASRNGFKTAVLPSPNSIKIGLNKALTIETAKQLVIPIPKTYAINNIEEMDTLDLAFPCVVKGTMEAGKNVVSYPLTLIEAKKDVAAVAKDSSQHGVFPIIQEYISGIGLGFFGFYQHGELKRFYMHERIREYPISGGASTAAKTIYHQKAFEYSKRLLDRLNWHGPAMVEFKYNPQTDRLALMEINPKFWGSTELGLAAGVNFGELLVRTINGEKLEADLSPQSYKRISFYWPFDGDLTALWQSKNWSGIKEYWKKDFQTNTRTNGFWLNCFRLAELLRGRGKR